MLPHLFEEGQGFLNKGFTKEEEWVRNLRLKATNVVEKHVPWLVTQRTPLARVDIWHGRCDLPALAR